MFTTACDALRESVYGVIADFGDSSVTGTAFMIAPGVCVTAAHVLREGRALRSQVLTTPKISVVRSPDILKTPMKISEARLLAEDVDIDLALIEIMEPTSSTSVKLLYHTQAGVGTSCGTLGFPFSSYTFYTSPGGQSLLKADFNEHFRGAYISGFRSVRSFAGSEALHDIYETDSPMYIGSSGSPGFTEDGSVFGMHVGGVNDNEIFEVWLPSTYIINLATQNHVNRLQVV